jgi:F0F1-type ATP synthase membrane subunit b/b'
MNTEAESMKWEEEARKQEEEAHEEVGTAVEEAVQRKAEEGTAELESRKKDDFSTQLYLMAVKLSTQVVVNKAWLVLSKLGLTKSTKRIFLCKRT